MSENAHQPVDVTASTLEQAIEKGLDQLGLSRNDVIIEIVEEGSRGVLGMGAREAVVRLTPLRAPKNAQPAAPAPVEPEPEPEPEAVEEPEPPAHVEAEQEVEHVHDAVEEEEPAPEPEPEPEYETIDGITYAVDADGYRVLVEDMPEPAPQQQEAPAAPVEAEQTVEEAPAPVAEPEPDVIEPEAEEDDFDGYDDYDEGGYDEDEDDDFEDEYEDDEDYEEPAIVKQMADPDDHEVRIAVETLRELLDHLEIEPEIEAYRAEADTPAEDAPWILNVQGTDLGILIGRRGETLNALQYITRLIVSRELQRRANLVIDVEGYKARRESSLRRLATRMAAQAKRMGSPVTLEPMPPNERRVIHITLREDDDVRTESSGTGNQRKVSIIPVDNGS